mgnify:CR=1 FL=1
MRAKLILFLLMMSTLSFSQQSSPAGIYYLSSVMETASGFKLNDDHTFEFFFSQGALDRTGSGTWVAEGDEIILNSKSAPEKGFILVNSSKIPGNETTVVVKDPNAMMLLYVYVSLISKEGQTEYNKLNSTAELVFPIYPVDKISLMFEICPERAHDFVPVHQGDNYFEFNFNPRILDVNFEMLRLKLVDGKLEGRHPLLKGDSFSYEKEQ